MCYKVIVGRLCSCKGSEEREEESQSEGDVCSGPRHRVMGPLINTLNRPRGVEVKVSMSDLDMTWMKQVSMLM